MGKDYVIEIARDGYPELSPTALRIFLTMASCCLDNDNPLSGEIEGLYFGGWRYLSWSLSHVVYDPMKPLAPAMEQRITRGIRELRRQGCLIDVPAVLQEQHKNKVYRLNIWREGGPKYL